MRVGLDVVHERRHVDIVAWLGPQPHLLSIVGVDELWGAGQDVDPGLALAVVMRTRYRARSDMCLAHPNRAASHCVRGQSREPRHPCRLRSARGAALRWDVVELSHMRQ